MLTVTALSKSLSQHWGYTEFRPHQAAICQAISNGQDVFVVASTGSGKSISFQLPPVAYADAGVPAFSLVVCPLVSLMEDQVAYLKAIGVSARFVGSTPMASPITDDFAVLYITPEKLLSYRNELNLICRSKKLMCIAVDECHCVLEWGFDFRPAYRNLCCIRDWFPGVPVVALTATATQAMISDIIHNLHLDKPAVFNSGFNRPNLRYDVLPRESDADVVRYVCRYYRPYVVDAAMGDDNEYQCVPSALVYAYTRKDAELIAQELQRFLALSGVRCGCYHAGMSLAARSEVHKAFSRDEINIVVATIAFGMGINKPDVRLVVHCGMPSSLEEYYQQTGRAGRDGEQSRCVLMHGRNDSVRLHGIKLKSHGAAAEGEQVRLRIAQMEQYCSRNCVLIPCRRKFLLHHFGEDYEPECAMVGAGQCCDMCDAAISSAQAGGSPGGWIDKYNDSMEPLHAAVAVDKVEVGGEVLLLLRAVLDCKEYFSLSTPIAILVGTKDKSVLQKVRGYERMKSYGAGMMHSKHWWAALGDQLVDTEGLLGKEVTRQAGMKFSYNRYRVTEKGKAFVWSHCEWSPREPILTERALTAVVHYELSPAPTLQRLLYVSPPVWGPRRPSPCVPSKAIAAPTVSLSGVHFQTEAERLYGRRSGTLIRRNSSLDEYPSRNSVRSMSADNGAVPTAAVPAPTGPPVNQHDLFDDETKRCLEARIRRCRASISESMGPDVAPYSILSTQDIKNLVHYRPISTMELKMLPGWGDMKAMKCGGQVVAAIRTFMLAMSLPVQSNMDPLLLNISKVRVERTREGDAGENRVERCDCDVRIENNACRVVRTESTRPSSAYTVVVKQEGIDYQSPRPTTATPSSGPATAVPPENACSTPPSHLPPRRAIASTMPSPATEDPVGSFDAPSPLPCGEAPLINPYSVGGIQTSKPLVRIGSTNKQQGQLSQKRKICPLMGLKRPPGTRLKRAHTAPEPLQIACPQSLTAASVTGNLAVAKKQYSLQPEHLEDSIMQFLKDRQKGSITDIIVGLVGSDDCGLVNAYSSRVREAVRSLAEGFCIYMDGDKYCAL